jgi:HrpA-like RNA helicase
LAATGVAQRVAEEVDMLQRHASALPMPSSSKGNKTSHLHGANPVGYMVKGDSSISQHTRIAFATYGVLLRRLQDDPALESMDFVILDEVHGMSSFSLLSIE